MRDELFCLLKRPLELGETYEKLADKVMQATGDLSEKERLVEILRCTISETKVAKPPHRPSLLTEFASNHEWLWLRENRKGEAVISFGLGSGPIYSDVLLYAFLIEEMEKRGGNLAAARAIVKEEKIDGLRNVWHHPLRTKKMTCEEAARKITTFFQRNRKRMIKLIENRVNRGDWIVLPRWASRLKVVQNVLPPETARLFAAGLRENASAQTDKHETDGSELSRTDGPDCTDEPGPGLGYLKLAPLPARNAPPRAKRSRKNSVSK